MITHVHYGLSDLQADVDLTNDRGEPVTHLAMTLRRRPLTRRWYAPKVSAHTFGVTHIYRWRTLPDWLRPTVVELVARWAEVKAS